MTMTMTPPEQIQITSDHGEAVEYTIHPFGAEEGFNLLPQIVKLLSAPAAIMASLMGAARPAAAPSPASTDDPAAAIADDAEAMFSGINTVALSAHIKDLAVTIVQMGGATFARNLLKNTAVTVNGETFKVGDKVGFERRYIANYGELFTAIYHVVRVNFGPILRNVMEGRDPLGALSALQGRAKATKK